MDLFARTVGAVGSLVASTASHPNTAFVVVFSIFVVAIVTLAVVTMIWAIRRDRSAFAEWRLRRAERAFGASESPGPDGPRRSTNGNGRPPGAPAQDGHP